jgi:hypothetical protein
VSLETDIARGQQARRILEDDLFKEAVAKVQQSVFDDFAQTDPLEVEALRVQRIRLKCLAEVVRELGAVMNTGKVAQAEVKQQQTLLDRARDRMKRGIRGVF